MNKQTNAIGHGVICALPQFPLTKNRPHEDETRDQRSEINTHTHTPLLPSLYPPQYTQFAHLFSIFRLWVNQVILS